MANNTVNLAPILFASFCLGHAVNPIDVSFGKAEVKSIIKITKPKIFFCDFDAYDVLKSSLRELGLNAEIFTFNGQRGKSIAVESLFADTGFESDFLPIDVDGEKCTAIIAISKGIKGTLEGICLSHALLLDKSTRVSSIVSSDILFAFSSIYWLSGIANLLKAIYFGATQIITTKPYSPEYFLALIEKYKITHIFAPTYQIIAALKHEKVDATDLSSVKSIALGGQNVHLDEYSVIKKYFANATPFSMFGLCELGGAITISRGSQLRLNGSGKLVNGIRVKIIDGNGNRLGINERGRILVESAYHFTGYYGREGNESTIDQDGFLNTGHVGYFDADGNLHVLGRETDMIKYQDFQISPEEIENVLIQQPAIKSVCVLGVQISDDSLVTALIVCHKNAIISADEVLQSVSDNFDDSYKLRGGVYFVDDLPSTPSGKVIRRLAKRIAEKEFGSRKTA